MWPCKFPISCRVYNCREHKKYKNGEWTEQQVFEEFLKNFEPEEGKDGKVGCLY